MDATSSIRELNKVCTQIILKKIESLQLDGNTMKRGGIKIQLVARERDSVRQTSIHIQLNRNRADLFPNIS